MSVLYFICFTARQQRYDVVLVDTAGRMQDNEPLMVSLAKVANKIFLMIIHFLLCVFLSLAHSC